jgi:hypothetical protein
MKSINNESLRASLIQQSANNLLGATLRFLHRNNIPKESVLDFVKNYEARRRVSGNSQYSKLQRSHEQMGVIMATWFSDPRFLDTSGKPIPLARGSGPRSIEELVRVSRARIAPSSAFQLMKASPSIKFCDDGRLTALRRVFVLPELELPRAAFVIERYLDTLQRNATSRKKNGALLLERSCHVSEVDLAVIAPLLRDIEGRGTAFMDSIDGEIEDQRIRRNKQKPLGEMGVLVFAWTKPPTGKRTRTKLSVGTSKPVISPVAKKRASFISRRKGV